MLLLSHVISYRLRYWNNSPGTAHRWFPPVTCDLIPLAVLKRHNSLQHQSPHQVTCDLIPLAVLKPKARGLLGMSLGSHMWSHTACGIETCALTCCLSSLYSVTCDLIPLAVLKLAEEVLVNHAPYWSHVISYRLRYWNNTADLSEEALADCHMWSHTACGIETCHAFECNIPVFICHMWSHTACGIETA